MSKDYYKILGVEKNAPEDEIKRAFRKKAHQYHPDKEGGDEAKFKEINEAYQVLSDKNKRSQYDQFGSAFDQGGQGGAGFNWQDFAGGFGGSSQYQNVDFDFGDIFSGIFGGGARGRSRENLDLETSLTLSFEEAVFGTKKDFTLNKIITCETCHGNGAKLGTKINTCSNCRGTGKVAHMQNVIFGHIQTQKICPECNGEGKVPEVKCADCSGQGVKKGQETISVKIPAGINKGEVIRITGKGNASGVSGLKGDLYIQINVNDSNDFIREHDNIHTEREIHFSQAILGDKINIKTIHGDIKLKIPAGTKSGTVFRLRGQGVPHLKQSGNGDHYVTVSVEVPKSLTREQKNAVKILKDSGL